MEYHGSCQGGAGRFRGHRCQGALPRREGRVWALLLAAAAALVPLSARADCADATAQADLTQCAYLKWLEADASLNLAYSLARGAAKSIDLALPAHDRGAERALREGQRGWIIMRDESCKALAWAMKGGSAEPMLRHGCMARLSQERAAFLRGFAESS